MEINRVFGQIIGGVANEDMVEGRMVCMTAHTFDNDFGSNTDLPGFKLPASAEEAKRAKFIVTWAEDNRQTPIYSPMPSFPWALRNTWDQASNVPFSATVYLTQPGHQNGLTIPSGATCLGYGNGTYTVKSGMYIDNANIVVKGSMLSVSYASETKGKLQYQATMDDSVVGVVETYDSATGELTFTSMHF